MYLRSRTQGRSRSVEIILGQPLLSTRIWRRACATGLIGGLLTGLASTLPAPASANPLPLNASAQQIRSIHAAAPQKAWKLRYRSDDKAAIELVVWPEYVQVTKDGAHTIFDYKWKRAIGLSDDGKRFFHSSLYASVGFLDFENEHRVQSAQIVNDASNAPPGIAIIIDPFWRASDLGLMRAPIDLLGGRLNKRADGGFTITYNGVTAVAFQPASQDVEAPHLASFYRTLRRILPVHPMAYRLMAESGHLPAVLQFTRWHNNQLQEQRWSLETAEPLIADYPLNKDSRPDFQLLLDRAGLSPGFLSQIVPSLRDVVAGKFAGRPSSWKAYRVRARQLLSDGERFDAGLLLIEYMIRSGACHLPLPTCDEAQELLRSATSDSRFQKYGSAFNIERQHPERAIEIWSSLDRRGLKYGYVIDIALGNAYQTIFFRKFSHAPEQDVERAGAQVINHFQAALEGNPLNSSIYKDLGDFYFRQFLPTEAWLLWDLGRELDVQFGSRNSLVFIDRFEAQLQTHYPEYFH